MRPVRTKELWRNFKRSYCFAGLAILTAVCAFHPVAQARLRALLRTSPLNVVIIGGGPTLDHNQVAIESNVRYVSRLLPTDTHLSTLFADGDTNSLTVLYIDDVKALAEDKQIMYLLLTGGDRNFSAEGHYRKPTLPIPLDGASTRQNVGQMIDRISHDQQAAAGGVLLYFTGHGSPMNGNLENNHYDVWGRAAIFPFKIWQSKYPICLWKYL